MTIRLGLETYSRGTSWKRGSKSKGCGKVIYLSAKMLHWARNMQWWKRNKKRECARPSTSKELPTWKHVICFYLCRTEFIGEVGNLSWPYFMPFFFKTYLISSTLYLQNYSSEHMLILKKKSKQGGEKNFLFCQVMWNLCPICHVDSLLGSDSSMTYGRKFVWVI